MVEFLKIYVATRLGIETRRWLDLIAFTLCAISVVAAMVFVIGSD